MKSHPSLRILVLLSLIAAVSCKKKMEEPAVPTPAPADAATAEAPAADAGAVAEEPKAEPPVVRPPTAEDLKTYTADLPGDGPLQAAIHTSMGTFHCELYDKDAPMTVANFIGLARGKHAWLDPRTREVQTKPLYDGTIFHRVIPDFMIQGGDPQGVGIGGPGYYFDNETKPNRKHDRGGILSMANAGPGTNGSQFFILEEPKPHLDGMHTVFGQCNEVDLVKKITHVPVGPDDKPMTDVVIQKIEISRGAPPKKK